MASVHENGRSGPKASARADAPTVERIEELRKRWDDAREEAAYCERELWLCLERAWGAGVPVRAIARAAGFGKSMVHSRVRDRGRS